MSLFQSQMDLGTIGSLKSLPISTELRNKDLFRDMRVNMGQQAHAQFVLQCPSTYCQASRPSVLVSPVQLFATPWTVAHQNPGDFPSKNPGVSCHFLLQGIFPTQGSNPGLPHCRWILDQLSHKESPDNCDLQAKVTNPGTFKIFQRFQNQYF